MSLRLSRRAARVAPSLIREMSRECRAQGGINLAQGLCDLPVPEVVAEAAREAIADGANTYSAAEGRVRLRRAVAAHQRRRFGLDYDADTQVMISAGATGAFYATAQALLDPGDEVILLEPYYGYHAATLKLLECPIQPLRLAEPDWKLTASALSRALGPGTRALVLSNPGNPHGRVLDSDELRLLADFAQAHDLVVFADEIYADFVYDQRPFRPPALLSGLRDRTITLGGFSKVFSITGWRLGYALGPPEVMAAATAFNDLVYVCAPTPLQLAAAVGLETLGEDFYQAIARSHEAKRDRFCDALTAAGLPPRVPEGAYYVMADISRLPGADDLERVRWLLQETGLAAVPGQAFYLSEPPEPQARFCFAKRDEILDDACRRLQEFAKHQA